MKDRSRISQTEEAQATVGGISYEKKTKDTASERRVSGSNNQQKEGMGIQKTNDPGRILRLMFNVY